MADKRSKLSRANRLRAFIDAMPEYLEKLAPWVLDGSTHAVADLVVYFGEELDAMEAVRKVNAQRAAAVAQERRLRLRNKPLLASVENLVRGAYGNSPKVLLAFGLEPRTPGRKSSEVKAVAIEKGRATRARKKAAREAAEAELDAKHPNRRRRRRTTKR